MDPLLPRDPGCVYRTCVLITPLPSLPPPPRSSRRRGVAPLELREVLCRRVPKAAAAKLLATRLLLGGLEGGEERAPDRLGPKALLRLLLVVARMSEQAQLR